MRAGLKKILFIHHSGGWGGAASCMVNLIKTLDRSKYEAEVLLLRDSDIAKKLSENGISYRIATSSFYRKYYRFFAHSEAGYIKWYQLIRFSLSFTSWLLSRFMFADKELSQHEFDIVHLNSSVLTDWIIPAKKKSRVIIHIREPFRKGKADLFHSLFRGIIQKNADQIICISHDNSRRLDIPEKSIVIYDFFDIPATPPVKESYFSSKVLYLGGSSTSKGFYTMVDALDYLDDKTKVLFAGKYVNTKKPENIIRLLKFYLSNARKRNVAIARIKSHPNAVFLDLVFNVKDYIDQSCCVISPFSVPHFSCPVAEAHINRKPAIGSDVEGMEEIIKNGINGLIVPKKNPKALAEAIMSYTTSPDDSIKAGESGFIEAERNYSPGNIRQFEQVYDNLI